MESAFFPLPANKAFLFPNSESTLIEKPQMSAKFYAAIHYEFTEFHRRISAPLAGEETDALEEYAVGLQNRLRRFMDASSEDDDYWTVARCLQIFDLVSCVMAELPATRLPRWLGRYFGDLDALLLEGEKSVVTNVARFWEIVKFFALLDLSAFVIDLLQVWQAHTPSPEVGLLLGFYTDVPPLAEISSEEALEKRRHLAALGRSNEQLDFIWKLHVCDETDDTSDEIRNMLKKFELSEWYWEVCLVWAWLHPMDLPGELATVLAAEHAKRNCSSAMATALDASVYAVLTLDFPAFFMVESSHTWFAAICADYLFYANGVLPEVRDQLLLKYCYELMGCSGSLGKRIAVDIIGTLSRGCAVRGSRELLGRLAREDRLIGPTKQWLLCVKLAHDAELDEAESMCLEFFHKSKQNNVVDAILALCVAAEVGKDIHLGACRISDYVDEHIPLFKEQMPRAQECSLKQIQLLPEYIQSGRFEFVNEWTATQHDVSALVRLVTSPNCPPESVLPLVLEIRAAAEKLSFNEVIAVQKVLIDYALDESLLLWFTTFMASKGV